MAGRNPRGAGRPHVGQGEFQHRRAVPDHPLAAARRPGVLPQGYAYGQDAALLRLGDHPREDPQILRQGDPLLLRNRDRKLQGGADDRPHRGDDLRGPRLAEGHPDRPQGREAEESRTDGARRHGTVPREEGFPSVVRQGQRRLAQQRAAITPVRIRTGIINRTERPFKEQNQSACGNSSPESYWEPPCCAARKPTHSTTGNIFSGSDVRA